MKKFEIGGIFDTLSEFSSTNLLHNDKRKRKQNK